MALWWWGSGRHEGDSKVLKPGESGSYRRHGHPPCQHGESPFLWMMHILAYLSAFPRQVFTSLLIRPLLRNLVTPLWVNYHATLKWGLCFSNFPTENKYQCSLSTTTSALHQRELIRSMKDTNPQSRLIYAYVCPHTDNTPINST